MTRAAAVAALAAVVAVLTAASSPGVRAAEKARGKKPTMTGAPATSLLPSPGSPLVTFRVQVRAGALDDPPGKEGLNAVTALTIGNGGTREMTYRQVSERLFPMAASIEPQPDRETTTFVGKVHRDHLQDFYVLFTSMLLQPRFDPADFTRNRDLLVASIETNLRGNDDENLGKAAMQWLVFQGHPYGRGLDQGTVRGLKSLTLDDVKRYYASHYTRKNVVLGVTGGYPPPMIDSLREDFMRLPDGGAAPPPLPAPRKIEGMDVLFVEKPAPATAISMGFPIDATRAHKDFPALLVVNSYFGQHRTFIGRLMNVMRAARGLNYGDYAYVEHFVEEPGTVFPLPNIARRQQYFSIWIRPVPPHNALFALRQATRELDRLVRDGLTREEFEATRTFLLNYSNLWTQSLSRRLGYQLDARFYGTDPLQERLRKELPKLKVADVNAAIRRHLGGRGLAVAIVTDDAAAMKATLLSGAPTPITYQTPTTDETLLREDKEIEAYPLPVSAERVRIIPAVEMFER